VSAPRSQRGSATCAVKLDRSTSGQKCWARLRGAGSPLSGQRAWPAAHPPRPRPAAGRTWTAARQRSFSETHSACRSGLERRKVMMHKPATLSAARTSPLSAPALVPSRGPMCACGSHRGANACVSAERRPAAARLLVCDRDLRHLCKLPHVRRLHAPAVCRCSQLPPSRPGRPCPLPHRAR
jgi:hypothetical protein